MRRFFHGLATMIALVTLATLGRAEPPRTSSLAWARLPGADACVSAPELARAVEKQLGRAVFVSSAGAEVVVDGRIEPSTGAPGFRAHLALLDARGGVLGTRDLQTGSSSCRALDDQLALVIALLIDPAALLASPSREPPSPRSPSPRATAPPLVVARTAPPVAPRRRWRTSVALGGAVAVGLLPGARGALVLRGDVTPPGFVPIQLGGALWSTARVDSGGKGATLSLAWGTLSVCPLSLAWGTTGLRACAGAALGAVRARGYGFKLSTGAAQVVAAGVVEGRMTQRLVGPMELGLGLGLLVPFERARAFYLDASGAEQEIARTGAVAGVLDLGVGVAFP
jgi:hypothetical protein